MPDQTKVRGVADIVFLLDATGSMSPCIDALRRNIATFVQSLTNRDGQNPCPVKDWRARVVAYRDYTDSAAPPLIDNSFVRSTEEIERQLSGVEATGGGDEPESLLDALYLMATVGQTERGAKAEDPKKWRHRSEAARVVIVFTDASFHPTMSIPQAKGGTIDDVVTVVHSNRLILSVFAPVFPCYEALSQIDKSEWMGIEHESSGPAEALAVFTSNQEQFKQTLRQLAASVSASAAVLED